MTKNFITCVMFHLQVLLWYMLRYMLKTDKLNSKQLKKS